MSVGKRFGPWMMLAMVLALVGCNTAPPTEDLSKKEPNRVPAMKK